MNRIASVLAFLIGAMAVVAGGQVLIGRVPGWLPVYNFWMGVLSALVVSVLLWRQSPYAVPASLATFGVHALALILLQTVYRDAVAIDSLVAMIIRLVTWSVILALLFVQLRKQNAAAL